MFTRTLKKAWYEIPSIDYLDGKYEIVYAKFETWFPERWEKKNAKLNFIKKKRSNL